jgi:hypothetical protein
MRTQCTNILLNHTVTTNSFTATPARSSVNTIDRRINGTVFDAVSFAIWISGGGISFDTTNYIGVLVEESDDNITWTPVNSASLVGPNGNNLAVDSSGRCFLIQTPKATSDTYPLTRKFDYVGSKAFVCVRPAFVGSHGAGTFFSIYAVLCNPNYMPV